jgi:hypothetical protein
MARLFPRAAFSTDGSFSHVIASVTRAARRPSGDRTFSPWLRDWQVGKYAWLVRSGDAGPENNHA